MLKGKRILLVISGGIAAYKAIELIRLLKKSGAQVRCILTNGGAQFITPLTVAAISEEHVYTDLFSLKDESEMGHIRLSREADLILVAPASANIMAQMAHGLAEDLASTTLLATNKPVMICPAMNPMMWAHTATQDNIATLKERGITIIEPDEGDMACGEHGAGRLPDPSFIHDTVIQFFKTNKPLHGYKAIVTSGPTYEPLDPVRFIGNRSSGKQGHAIAQSLVDQGATVTLITGPVSLPDPEGITTVHVETALDMLEACEKALPANIAICAAAVSDWRAATHQNHKIKKSGDETPPTITLVENPDILKTIAQYKESRPSLVIGFAAETQNLLENAKAKLDNKGCDWVIGNNVTADNVFGNDQNHVYLIDHDTIQEWPIMDKKAVANALTEAIIEKLNTTKMLSAAE